MKKSIFLRNSILYTVGSMLTPLIGFIMLPIYTNYLTPSEYGTLSTITTLVGMFQVFLLLSLHGAVTRFYFEYVENSKEQREYLGAIYLFVIIFSTTLSFLLITLKNQIGSLLFSIIPIDPYFILMVALSWSNALLALPFALIRAQERAGMFVLANFLITLSIMVLNVYIIVIKDLGIEKVLLSQFLITFIAVLILVSSQFKYLKFNLNYNFIKLSLLFSIPLLPHVASGWIIKSSDRVILEKFVSLTDIGVYAVAVQVSMVLIIFYQSINSALVPRYIKLMKDNQVLEAEKILKIFKIIIFCTGILAIPISMIATRLLVGEDFINAVWLLPALLIANMIKGIYYIPVAKLFYDSRTGAIATSSTIAAITNIVVNFSLIPYIGIIGAVISTLLSEIIRTILIYIASKQKKYDRS
ncbi:oligosaccharide flippase family protein [Planococcus sp. A6]|uniref:oligosaccharide flippase family protein n=1 Tax=Planococcus sp. A6 TaxID=2992760 RepID=UPI00237B2875|nr:oligosaccharide flippase family protein [Planococcus sp. A6]MDE0582101.1 oligosaccharide flippase family protein [Planococcus sp. A6]